MRQKSITVKVRGLKIENCREYFPTDRGIAIAIFFQGIGYISFISATLKKALQEVKKIAEEESWTVEKTEISNDWRYEA